MFVILTLPIAALCQEDKEISSRFSVDFKVGAAIPVGAFVSKSKSNPTRDDEYVNGGRYRGVLGKEGNGFAKPGFTWSGEIAYRFAKAFFGGMIYQRATNPVDLAAANDYLRTLDDRVTTRQDDYIATFFAPMVGYQTMR